MTDVVASAKKIGPVLATFVVANNMIGSGFFLLPATLAKSGGVTALAWLLGTILAIVLGAAFARLARAYPDMTSPDDYVRPALGRDMGFLATTLYWISSWIGNNAIAVAAFGYIVALLQLGDGQGVRLFGQVALIWLMFAINLMGPRPIARFQSLCVVFGLLPVVAVLTAGWGSFDPEIYRAAWNVSGETDAVVVMASLAPIFWAFVGLETGAMVAGVVRDPDRNVPRATIGGILIAGVVYLVSSVLMMGIVPAERIAESSAPFALVAGEMFGVWAVPVIAAAAAIKATGTLGGWMLVSGESGARAAHRGFLPAIFGRLNPNGSARWGLFIIASAMTLIAVFTLAPTVSSQFETIINMVVTLVVMAYIAAGLSLLLGSPELPSGPRERLLGMGALVACGLLVYSTPVDTLVGGLVIALLCWAGYRGFARRATR
ncbi:MULTISPECIES: amino acid permease [unclassified Luteimonas]|uniref:amino acid permease n=1 Tax=unclassified Luteimonas TaxID=2629088 RepID=UPI0016009DA7|nr:MULTISPECIES: amino acid permease [unclassified Luteimonas]MBB1471618.1 amino acid permease [Luteimonas sp. MC1782]MBB6599643.1 amino acid permease [Luteimonas sp. MC1825]QOC87332.1 amino acid permease [Luteimonas sp. MC1825]